jgi:hypothetical protein
MQEGRKIVTSSTMTNVDSAPLKKWVTWPSVETG